MTYEEALRTAREWAATNYQKSGYAAAALAYIDAMDLAKREAQAMGLKSEYGERTQLLYILANLTTWRGPLAREAKEAIKKRVAELGG